MIGLWPFDRPEEGYSVSSIGDSKGGLALEYHIYNTVFLDVDLEDLVRESDGSLTIS